jgi:hypothetical protein
MKAAYPDATPNSIENALNEKYKHFGNLYEVDIPDEAIDKMLDWDAPLSEQPESVRKALQLPSLDEAKLIEAEGERIAQIALDSGNVNGPEYAAFNEFNQSRRAGLARVVVNEANPRLYGKGADGEDIYSVFVMEHRGREAASATLNDLGIPGIKYYDQGSRGAGRNIDNMSRKELADVLAAHDPNGIYTDADAIAEFGRPHTREELLLEADEEFQKYLSELDATRNFVVFDENLPKIIGSK